MTDHDSRLDKLERIRGIVEKWHRSHTDGKIYFSDMSEAAKEIWAVLEESPKQEYVALAHDDCNCGGLTSGAKTVKEHAIALEKCPRHGKPAEKEQPTCICSYKDGVWQYNSGCPATTHASLKPKLKPSEIILSRFDTKGWDYADETGIVLAAKIQGILDFLDSEWDNRE